MAGLFRIAKLLIGGAEQLAATLIRRGKGIESITRSIFRRFGEQPRESMDILIDFTEQGIGAGDYLSGIETGGQVDVSRIPENPYLFGGDPAGRRFLLFNDISIGQDFEQFEIRTELPDFSNLEDLFAQIDVQVENRARRSPRNPYMQAVAEALEHNTIITFAERAW